MTVLNQMERHLDNIDDMKASIKKDIEVLFSKLNVKNFVSAPGDTVDVLIFAITERIIKKYVRPLTKESKGFVNNVIKSEKKL